MPRRSPTRVLPGAIFGNAAHVHLDPPGEGTAIGSPRPAATDIALTIAVAAVLGITTGVLLGDALAGVAVGGGITVVFRLVLRTIITRR